MSDEKDIQKLLTEVLEYMRDAEKSSFRVSVENQRRLEQIYVILNGNGSPQDGMVFKVTELYKWMGVHKTEHDSQKDKTWDVIRGIIQWTLPLILYGLAYIAVVGL